MVLHLLGFPVIQQLLENDHPGDGRCNEHSFPVGLKLGQRRLVWVEF